MNRKLYRSSTNRFVAGVCGGLGDFFKIDANLIRIGIVIISVISAFIPMVLIYTVCALIVPLEPGRPGDVTIDGDYQQ